MNFNKFFELAKEKGISSCQIKESKTEAVSFNLFKHELDSFKIKNSRVVAACGLYNGKFGSAYTEKLDSSTAEYLVNQIILNATYSEKTDDVEIFPGSEKYKKKNVFNKDLEAFPIKNKIALMKKVENKLYEASSLVRDVIAVSYSETSTSSVFTNSFGLKLKEKSNYCSIMGGVVLEKEGVVKTYYDVFFNDDLNKFVVEDFVANIIKCATDKFGGTSIEANKYPTVIKNEIFADLVSYFIDASIAETVQKHSSFLEGKLNTKVASSKVTIENKPLAKNFFYTYYDGEGVATKNFPLVKNGVLSTYLYNRETAKKDGVETNACATWGGGAIGTGYHNIFVKPGKKSFDEMISSIEKGVYITEIAGLETGINATSGDFSCQAEGFLIENGKLSRPLTLITLSGNLLKMLKDVKEFDNNLTLTPGAITLADVLIKKMSIGGGE